MIYGTNCSEDLSRRAFLLSGTAAILANSNAAYAQDVDFSGVVAETLDEAASVLGFAINIEVAAIDAELPNFVAADYFSRRSTFLRLRNAGINLENYDAYASELSELGPSIAQTEFDQEALGTLRLVAEQLVDEGLELLPEPESVEPISVPSLPPEPEDDDNNLKVIIDILAEGFGIGNSSLLVSFVEDRPELRDAFTSLAQLISNQDWQAVAELLEIILSGSVIRDFVNSVLIGASRRTKRRFLHALALRAIPFVGWLYTIASLIIAFKSNYHRFSIA
ncbi:hypothetical protein [Actibacterium ureilyticum]|uniref:hypothetical protein n=1 Tax=Actibacterium ureilyticum TaxID=1590614 RepID=UPI001140D127|nr:hypothetical protein [Actibacterium ureilyticum]